MQLQINITISNTKISNLSHTWINISPNGSRPIAVVNRRVGRHNLQNIHVGYHRLVVVQYFVTCHCVFIHRVDRQRSVALPTPQLTLPEMKIMFKIRCELIKPFSKLTTLLSLKLLDIVDVYSKRKLLQTFNTAERRKLQSTFRRLQSVDV